MSEASPLPTTPSMADTEASGRRSKRQAKTNKAEDKWGQAVLDVGFSIVPSLLLKAQRRLGISAAQLAVLLHLADHWWEADKRPFPARQTIADRMGITPRQVQRIVADLEKAGLVKRIERRHNLHGGKQTNIYDLSGLVAKLQALEPEFREAEASIRKTRKNTQLPPHLRDVSQ